MSLPRRARVIRAEVDNVPAFDVLRLVQPQAYMDVPVTVLQLYNSKSANVRWQVFDSCCCLEENMGVAEKVRDAVGASQHAARFPRDVAELLQVSREEASRSMLGHANFAFKWQR